MKVTRIFQKFFRIAFSFVLFLLLGALFVINNHAPKLNTFIPTNDMQHQDLARLFWEQGNKQQAQKELSFTNHANILGASTTIEQWEDETNKKRTAYIYWEQITKNHPTYRDGFIQLALTAYGLGEKEKANTALQNAFQLDPNNKEIPIFIALLQE